jgi:hypothetical protein
VSATITGTFDTASGSSVARMNVCYQPSGGSIAEFDPVGYVFVDVTTSLLPYTVSATHVFATAGTYTVGFCVWDTGATSLVGDWVQGWMLIT